MAGVMLAIASTVPIIAVAKYRMGGNLCLPLHENGFVFDGLHILVALKDFWGIIAIEKTKKRTNLLETDGDDTNGQENSAQRLHRAGGFQRRPDC
jgi:hypothetical protein